VNKNPEVFGPRGDPLSTMKIASIKSTKRRLLITIEHSSNCSKRIHRDVFGQPQKCYFQSIDGLHCLNRKLSICLPRCTAISSYDLDFKWYDVIQDVCDHVGIKTAKTYDFRFFARRHGLQYNELVIWEYGNRHWCIYDYEKTTQLIMKHSRCRECSWTPTLPQGMDNHERHCSHLRACQNCYRLFQLGAYSWDDRWSVFCCSESCAIEDAKNQSTYSKVDWNYCKTCFTPLRGHRKYCNAVCKKLRGKLLEPIRSLTPDELIQGVTSRLNGGSNDGRQ